MNTTEFLAVSSAICPDRHAIVFEGQRFTFGDLATRSTKLANALAGLGVKKGDRVAIVEVNTNRCIESYFACAKVGAVYVPLNFRARADEITFMVNESGASVLDASVGGLGGCPFAPRATGNICTEDLVYLLEGEGVETGIDLDALVGVSKRVQEIVGRVLPGQIAKAGKWSRRYPLPDGVQSRLAAK